MNNIFENSNATQQSVDQSIKDAISKGGSDGLLASATFTSMYQCILPVLLEPKIIYTIIQEGYSS